MKKKLLLIISIMLVMFFVNINDIVAKKVIRLKECEYTEEFKRYMKLSDKEKKNAMIPPMCKTNYSTVGDTIVSSDLGDITADKFDLRTKELVTSVKNQGNTNSCWAFSTNDSIESNLLMNGYGNYDLSESHMELLTQNTFKVPDRITFNRAFNVGGSFFVSSSYLLNNNGSVLESEVPFSIMDDLLKNNSTEYNISNLLSKKVKVSAGAVAFISSPSSTVCAKENITTDQIKSYLITHGAISAMMYFDNVGLDYDCEGDNCFLKSNSLIGPYYYYDGLFNSNHAVTIVGWDNTIKKENFKEGKQPKKDGAWIVKNSYGEKYGNSNISMGDNGYFYVSYEDAKICEFLAGFYNANLNLSDNIYYYDDLGWNSEFTHENDIYLGNRYDKKNSKNEKIEKITFASGAPGMDYTIYFSSSGDFSELKEIKTGTTKYKGYETVELNEDLIITDEEYFVAVKYKANTPIPVYIKPEGELWNNVKIYEDSTYLSLDLDDWEDTTSALTPFNASIKVYTSNTNEMPDNSSNESTTIEKTTSETANNKDKENIEIEVIPNENNKESYISKDVVKNPSTSDYKIDIVITVMLILTFVMVLAITRIKKYKNI